MKILLFILLFIQTLEKSDVYFIKEISSSKMVEMLKKLNLDLTGKVGLKIHSGEPGGLYFLKPDFLQEIYDYTNGTFFLNVIQLIQALEVIQILIENF